VCIIYVCTLLNLVVFVDNHRAREESKCLVKSNNQDCLVQYIQSVGISRSKRMT